MPLLLALLGLALLLAPNAASALASKVLGWILIAWGVGSAIVTITGWPASGIRGIIVTILLIGIGIYLSRNPLALAANLGKLAGIFLVIQGGISLLDRRGARVLPIVTLAVGIFLLLFPMTLSKLLFRILGLVLQVSGLGNLLARLRLTKALQEPDDPNIIDAAP